MHYVISSILLLKINAAVPTIIIFKLDTGSNNEQDCINLRNRYLSANTHTGTVFVSSFDPKVNEISGPIVEHYISLVILAASVFKISCRKKNRHTGGQNPILATAVSLLFMIGYYWMYPKPTFFDGKSLSTSKHSKLLLTSASHQHHRQPFFINFA